MGRFANCSDEGTVDCDNPDEKGDGDRELCLGLKRQLSELAEVVRIADEDDLTVLAVCFCTGALCDCGVTERG